MSPNSLARLRVLISGGGIAGNALAFWLARQGHDVTVLERFPGLRATGLQLDLRGPGIEVLRRMGLEDAFRARAAPEQGFQMVDRAGRRRAYFPASKPGARRQDFTSEFEIMRGDLCRLLYDAARTANEAAPPRYLFGAAVESFREEAGAVEVRFEDGKTEAFDLLVGADGQWSRTRRIMFGTGPADDSHGLRRLPGLYMAYFTAPRPMREEEGREYLATSYIAPGRRGMLVRRHSPDQIQVILSCRLDRPELLERVPRGDAAREKAVLADVFRGAGWQTDELLAAMATADDFYCERIGLVQLPRWSSGGRVALVGDAAYCPTVLSGMGTTCALVGAYVLAGEIGARCGRGPPDGVEAALRAYEDRFRPFVDWVQKGVLQSADGQWAMPASAFGVGLIHLFMGLASFFRINLAALFGIRETVKGWELPEYEHLRA